LEPVSIRATLADLDGRWVSKMMRTIPTPNLEWHRLVELKGPKFKLTLRQKLLEEKVDTEEMSDANFDWK
jgi:alkylated DNA nucleotide flippase Atl1